MTFKEPWPLEHMLPLVFPWQHHSLSCLSLLSTFLFSFYAILTIFLTISVCAGIIVLLGWELNIVKSVTLTMSVGLSIDFCIHYGMGYRLSELKDRQLRVQDSFEKSRSSHFHGCSHNLHSRSMYYAFHYFVLCPAWHLSHTGHGNELALRHLLFPVTVLCTGTTG